MNELYTFLAVDVPRATLKEKNFLEIIGKEHDENINSRLYAYFLDSTLNPEISNLFLDALRTIIRQKIKKDIKLISWEVRTEVTTRLGNRIDIVLFDQIENSAIIIENKIYHHLNNDLIDYWNHFGIEEENQVGIILTLEPNKVPLEVEGKFINVTHYEWLTEVRSSGLPAALDLKTYIYLNDFFNTIDNITTSADMNEQATFFFQNAAKVRQINATYEAGKKYLETQIEQLADNIGWSTYGNSYGWRNIWDKEIRSDVFYTILYKDLLEGGNTITVVVEMNREIRKRMDEVFNLLAENEEFLAMKKGRANSTNVHLVYTEYSLTSKDLSILSDFLYEKIISDFNPLMEKILHHFYPNKY